MNRLIIVWLGRNSGPRNSFYCLGHFKNVYDDDDDDDKQLSIRNAERRWELSMTTAVIMSIWVSKQHAV